MLHERVEALDARTETLELEPGFPLFRVTLFVSYGCNLSCPYCKTIARSPEELAARPEKRLTYTLADFERLLDGLAPTPVQHLHFTGGEASIVRDVVQMVAEAKRRGIPHLSMTSNGTASPRRYVELIDAGLTELRVSVDARDAVLGARMTGSARAWSKSIEAIRTVAAARDAGAQVRLLANTVVGTANRADLPGLVRFLLSLGPDDVKLITEVDARDELPDFPEHAAVRRELAEIVEGLPRDRFPLLRRKLETVFSKESIGLGPTAAEREGGSWRCYIPLTERTVDGVSYYPCSVYLREGGAPIGPLTDSAAVQREKTAAWVRDNDCRTDALCERYCLHCTRAFNDVANQGRRKP